MANPPANDTILSALFDKLQEGILYYTPVTSDAVYNGAPADFMISYCNEQAARMTGVSKDALTGKTTLAFPNLDTTARKALFQQLEAVYISGTPSGHTLYNLVLKRHFRTFLKKVKDGVLGEVKDVTDGMREQLDKQRQTELSNQFLDTSLNGWCICEPIMHVDGTLADLLITRINPAFTRILGLSEEKVSGKRFLSVFPAARENGTFDMNCRVFETGIAEGKLIYYRGDGLDAWYDVAASRTEHNTILITFADFSIIGKAPYGVVQYRAKRNAAGKVVDFTPRIYNPKAAELAGFTLEEIATRSVQDLMAERGNFGFFDAALGVVESGEPVNFEYFSRNLQRWINYSIIKYEDGILVNYIDITRQKASIQRVEQQKAIMDSLLENSPSGIMVMKLYRNEAGAITDAQTILINDAAAQYTGTSKDVYLSGTIRQKDPHIFEQPSYQNAIKRLEAGEPCKMQYQLQSTGQWIEVAIANMDGDHLVIMFTDITNNKQSQLKLESLVKELQRSNENLEEFTRAASHDLKEPVRKILVFTDLLKSHLDAKLSEPDQRNLERIETAAQRMKLLIDDLLEYSHVNTGLQQMEDIDLNKKLSLVLMDLELPIKESAAQISVGHLPVVKGYRRQIQQLFQNLISNALKYTRPGEQPVIEIQSREVSGRELPANIPVPEREGRFYVIDVKDNGIGFEPEDADRIFGMFTRLHTRDYLGTGVGLSIVRRVAENHKGYVYATSEPGKGSTFHVILPVS